MSMSISKLNQLAKAYHKAADDWEKNHGPWAAVEQAYKEFMDYVKENDRNN